MPELTGKKLESMRDLDRKLWRIPLLSNYRGRGRVWTQADLDELRRLYGLGRTFAEIGDALGRSRGNCVVKAHALQLPARCKREQCRRGYERWLGEAQSVDRRMEDPAHG